MPSQTKELVHSHGSRERVTMALEHPSVSYYVDLSEDEDMDVKSQPLQKETSVHFDSQIANPPGNFRNMRTISAGQRGQQIGANTHLGHGIHRDHFRLPHAIAHKVPSAQRIGTKSLGCLPLRKPMTPKRTRRMLGLLTVAAPKRQLRPTSTPCRQEPLVW